ncbi:hypothetical protein JNUCC42_14720 [Brevibacterium sp. JNUCC-42]|nr:hypothetical protein JNUCC42_14720 [Brevibacterium sp. JNUCC-42]
MKKASKWMIGALALAVLVPTAAFAAATPKSGTVLTAELKTENGVQFYSTDNGKTWNEFTPISTDEAFKFTVGKDGVTKFESVDKDSLGDIDNAESLSIKNENGVQFYSTDNGKTWSKTAPEYKN